MTAPVHVPAIVFLRRAGLYAAVLALVAGIFGMHVMTTTNAVRSPATAGAAVSAHHESSASGHTGDHAPGPSSAPDMTGAQGEAGTRTVQCTDSGTCTSMQAMTASCTPSAKAGSLTAPLPGTGIIARSTNTGSLATISARWSYFPGSPSPGELCISRT
ncbi:UNVERIFIED_ORG: hypothetical protein ABIB19_000206 [Arthrobacter sp. UYEF10]|uniref:hypothetical protein n=1 Tax=unclassified Arthrobacter TaxID=235627 RepID=UPI00339A58E2